MIGLGGTGQKVLVELKARFIRDFGQVPGPVEFLAIDTDTHDVVEAATPHGPVRLIPGVELLDISGVPAADIVQHLSRYPSIASWLLDYNGQPPRMTVGANRVRPLGRLAFFWHVGEIYNHMLAAVHRLTRPELEAEKRGMNVFIVTSVCGGTGSGIFLDMAYLMRHAVSQSNIRESSCYINGVLALPSVFSDGNSDDMQSNAFAALSELDYLMENPSWKVDYGNQMVNTVSFRAQRPFNICYLIDARNENGQGLRGLEESVLMIAEAVYLQISSQVGKAHASSFDNVYILGQSTLEVATNETHATAYSSLGTASLNFPAGKIIEYCANKLNSEIIAGELLNSTLDLTVVVRMVEEFLEANRLDPHTLLERLTGEATDEPDGISIDPGQLENVRYNDLIGAVDEIVTRAGKALDSELFPRLALKQAPELILLEKAVEREVERLVDDPNNSLFFADIFLLQLGARLTIMSEKLGAKIRQLDIRSQLIEESRKNAYAAFEESYTRGHTGRERKKTFEAGVEFLNEVEAGLQEKLDAGRHMVSASVLSGLITAVEEQRGRIQGLIDKLRLIEKQFRSTVDRITSEDRVNVLAQEITTQADIENYYQQYKAHGSNRSAGLASHPGPFGQWLNEDQEIISQHLLVFGREVFHPIGEITLESVILAKDDKQIGRRLYELIERSVPFWSYRKADVLEHDWRPQEIIVIGVEGEERSIFKNTVQVAQRLASTFDKHQIVVLQTKHGLPLFALTQYDQFRKSHDNVMMHNLKPLYVLPEVRPGGHKAKQVFALSIIFGEIFVSGAFYYAKAENEVDPPISLGQGMTNSLQYLRSNNDLIRSLEKRIDDRVQNIGKGQASEKVEAWIASPAIDERKGGVNNVNTEMIKNSTIGGPTYVAADLIADLRKLMQTYNRDVLKG